MDQLPLPMLTVYEGPRLIDPDKVRACTTYREVVRLCWAERTRLKLTKRLLAEAIGSHAPHVTDYLAADDGKERRSLKAEHVAAFEVACGNRAITQWLAMRAGLTVVEPGVAAVLDQLRRVA